MDIEPRVIKQSTCLHSLHEKVLESHKRYHKQPWEIYKLFQDALEQLTHRVYPWEHKVQNRVQTDLATRNRWIHLFGGLHPFRRVPVKSFQVREVNARRIQQLRVYADTAESVVQWGVVVTTNISTDVLPDKIPRNQSAMQTIHRALRSKFQSNPEDRTPALSELAFIHRG